MTEGLVSDKTRDRWVGDNVVNTGSDRLRRRELANFVHKNGHKSRHSFHRLAHKIRVCSLASHYHLLAVAEHGNAHNVDPGIELIELAILRDKELRNGERQNANYRVDHALILGKDAVADLLGKGEHLLLGVVLKVAGTREGLDERLVLDGRNADLTLCHLCRGSNRRDNLVGESLGIAANVVKRILEEGATVVHLDDETALGHASLADIGHFSVGEHRGGLNVRTQNANVGIGFGKLAYKGVTVLAPRIEKL